MSFSKELMKGVSETIVLQTLNELNEAYGYQLVKAIDANSNGAFQFQEGTLYPLLYRLEDKGFIQSEKKSAPNGKERRYYSVTKAGLQSLKEQSAEVENLVSGIQHLFANN